MRAITPTDRRELILKHLDLSSPGLEIGALDKPLVGRGDGAVLYVDHAGTDELRRKYRDDPNVGDIVDVDVVWSEGRLAQSLGGKGPVSWVIASHVLEHAPDLVGWLEEVAEVLAPGGILSLALPDKRFCFDAKRRPSDLSDVVGAHVEGRRQPSLAAVFDFWARYTTVDCNAAWGGRLDRLPDDDDQLGLDKARLARAITAYNDVHCWVFTPASLIDILRRLVVLGLMPWYEIVEFTPTPVNAVEFFLALRRLPDDLDGGDRLARQLASIPTATDDAVGAGPLMMPLSRREARLVEYKRAFLYRVRRLAGATRSNR